MLFEKKEIFVVVNVFCVIDVVYKVCCKFDGGMLVNDIVDGLCNDVYNIDLVMCFYFVCFMMIMI